MMKKPEDRTGICEDDRGREMTVGRGKENGWSGKEKIVFSGY